MADKILGTINIGFGEEAGSTEGLNRPIVAQIDSDQQSCSCTRFFDGDEVIITVFSSAPITVKKTNFGSIGSAGTLVRDFKEFVTFVNSNEATLTHIPKAGSFQFSWVGARFNPNALIVDEKTLKILNPEGRFATGLIKVTYKADASLFRLSSGKNPTLVTFTNQDDNTASVQIEFLPEECDTPVNDVKIIVKDNLDGRPVKGAAVTINGVARGLTGNDGSLFIGRLVRGQVNSIDITKTGYQSTGSDCLDNSEFTL